MPFLGIEKFAAGIPDVDQKILSSAEIVSNVLIVRGLIFDTVSSRSCSCVDDSNPDLFVSSTLKNCTVDEVEIIPNSDSWRPQSQSLVHGPA
jgi:hypothetical protein